MNRHWMPWLICLMLAGSGWCLGSRGEAPASAAARHTTLQLLAQAETAGEIDADTAVEYGVYAVKEEAKVPERYRGTQPMKDATGVLRQARARFPELRPEVQERLRPYLYPKGMP